MIRLPATEGIFQVIKTFTSPANQFGYESEALLDFAADLLIVSVINENQKPWSRGGRVFQAWERPDKYVFSRNNWINLDTPTLIEIEPVETCIIRYEPPSYLGQYQIIIEARPYTNPFLWYA